MLFGLIAASSMPVLANSLQAQNKALTTHTSHQQTTRLTKDIVKRVITGVQQYYISNSGTWPTALADISTFYSGSFITPAGTITGSPTPTGFNLTVSVRSSDKNLITMLNAMASKNAGTLTGNILNFPIASPNQYAPLNNIISRFEDVQGGGERNKLHAAVNMNGNDITGIDNTNIQTANVVNATIKTSLATNLNVVNANITEQTVGTELVTQLNADVANYKTTGITTLVNNGVINSTPRIDVSKVNAGGYNVIANGGVIKYQGQDVTHRYLGINSKADDSLRLGGVDGARFLQRNKVNNFRHSQKFNNSLVVNGQLTTGTVTASNTTVNGRIYGNQIKATSRATINGKNAQSYDNRSRIHNVNKIKEVERKIQNQGTAQIGVWN
ncbi:hypothetical protein BCT01_00615 [Vibrio tasmaniensis]|nr:hypothetical protein BCT01_00615 [Vibrio tasmaniensis]